MRFSPILSMITALGLAGGAAVAAAQDVTAERVQLEIERTDARIEQAQMAVAGSNNEMAGLALREATTIQARAKTEFASLHLRIALDLTLRARLHASRAIALIRGTPDPERVRAQLERTRQVIERARDRIEECAEDRARALLRAAVEMQVRAEAAFSSERFLAALQLTTSARERALRALRLCHMQENVRENAERALKRTDEVIARARDEVAETGSERARQMLGRAVEIQERAYAEFRAEHFEASLRLTHSARTFAQRAIRIANGEAS